MKKTAFIITAIMVVLSAANPAQAGVSMVFNGSFESEVIDTQDFPEETPSRWCDVNIPADKFGGYIDDSWSSHEANSLTLYADWKGVFTAGDMATVSQEVYLTDVNSIFFDIDFVAGSWDTERFSAVVMIDGGEVWDSNVLGPDADGQYAIEVNDINVSDQNLHTLSLGIKAVTNGGPYYIFYQVRWDFVKFDTHCGGFGYLPRDLDRNCYVDMGDLRFLAEDWLGQSDYQLFEDESGIINFLDFAVLADAWLDNTDWQNWGADNCYQMPLLSGDLNDDGIVNLSDFAILGGHWGADVSDCTRADINRSGAVDYNDLSELTGQWLQKSWLYGVE